VCGNLALPSGFLWRHMLSLFVAVSVRKHNDSMPGRLAEDVSGRI
jgi:hypothetical protein